MMQLAVVLIASLLILGAALGTASRAWAAPPAKSSVATPVKSGWIKGVVSSRMYLKMGNVACADIVVQAFDPTGRLVAEAPASGAPGACTYSLKVVPTGDLILGATIPQPSAEIHKSLDTRWFKAHLDRYMKLKPPAIKLSVTNNLIRRDKWNPNLEVNMPLYVDGVQQ